MSEKHKSYKELIAMSQELFADDWKAMKEARKEFQDDMSLLGKQLYIAQNTNNQEEVERCTETIKELDNLQHKAKNGWSEDKIYCFESFIEASMESYLEIAKQCKENGITHVYDIGCCTAFQSKIFQHMGIQYTGVELLTYCVNDSPKGKGIDYINKEYPFEIKVKDKEHTAAISNLCVGFLIQPAEKCYSQLSKDFRYFCGGLGPDKFTDFCHKFGITHIGEDRDIIWADTQKVKTQNKEAIQKYNDNCERIYGYGIVRPIEDKPKGRSLKKKNQKAEINTSLEM